MADIENTPTMIVMEGIYKDSFVWVPFNSDTRKFFERSYYGNVYNSLKKPILNKLKFVEQDEDSNEVEILEDDSVPAEIKPTFIVLKPLEALYLIERQKLQVTTEKGDQISFNDLIETSMESDPRIWQKYIVYRDIRHRGYIIRVGFGGNADFRVFERGARFAKDSAKFVYFIIQDGIPVALNELEHVVNQVFGDRKKLILAIFDKLGDSTFYRLERFKFKKVNEFDTIWNKEAKFFREK
ncbi:MAG: tRNA-intron lyase [Promethearchaeota archaeon]